MAVYLRELYVDVQLWGPDESKRVYEILGGDDHTLRNNTSKEVTVLISHCTYERARGVFSART